MFIHSFYSSIYSLKLSMACCIVGDRKAKIDEALVNMIVKDSQPFKV